MTRLTGKVALVTGGALGIGYATAHLFAAEGATVVVGDVNEGAGLGACERITAETGARAIFKKLDVSSEASWTDIYHLVDSQLGRLDVLVNNAGIYLPGTTENATLDAWEKTFAVNVRGVFLGAKGAIPLMRKGGAGSVINVASNWGLVGFPNSSAYCASKGAVTLLTKAMAAEVAVDRIRVNSVHPALTVSALSEETLKSEEATRALLGSSLLGRPAEAREVATTILFLASDDSVYMTGSELVVDGGYTAV